MKIKWLLLVVFILILLSWIPWPIAMDYSTTVSTQSDTVSVFVEKVGVRLNGALILRNVSVESQNKTVSIDRLVVWSNPFALLSLHFNQDKLTSFIDSEEYLNAEQFLAKRIYSIKAKGISYEDSQISFDDGKLEFGRKWGHFRGNISIPAMSLWGIPQGTQHFAIDFSRKSADIEFVGEIASGTVSSNILFRNNPIELNKFNLDIKKVQLEELFEDSLMGEVRGEFRAHSVDEDSLTIVGDGSLHVRNFSDNNSRILSNLRSTLTKVGVDSVRFEDIEVELSLEDSVLICDTLIAEGVDLNVDGIGFIEITSGQYELDITGYLPKEAEETVSPSIWGGLYPDTTTGGRMFGGELSGRGKYYSVSVDGEIIRRSVRSFFRNIFN